jgi:hypothetical protein
MKVKVFNIGVSGLEEEINHWLTANPKVKVQHVEAGQESRQRLIVLIFYEGSEGEPGMMSAFPSEGPRHINFKKKNKS